MKQIILIAFAMYSLTACNQADLDKANLQKDSLNNVIAQRDSSMTQALDVFLEIEKNLNEITIKEKVIVINNDRRGEMSQTTRERINLQISSINNLMARNNKLIAQLSKESKNANVKNASLLKAIVVLNNRLLEKDMDLKRLDQQLQSSNDKVIVLETIGEDLRTQNNQNAASIVELTGSLHTAYYIVGSAKELENLNIIDKKGGILGMGKTKQLKEDFEKTNFTYIDYTEIVIIPVNGKEAKLISNHPAESYYMELDVNMKNYTSNLIILDAEKFWSVSKYLVVTKKV
jgi:hypothetical protein